MSVWQREKSPTPIPDPCTATVLRLVDDTELGAILRSNLLPREDRNAHRELWYQLAFNADLAERGFDQLESLLDATETQVKEHPDDRRAVRFAGQLRDAWNRLLRMQDISKDSTGNRPGAETATGRVVLAIAEHELATETPTAVDQALWRAPREARGRVNRLGHEGREWRDAPTFTSQLFDAVSEHRRLTVSPRPPDQKLWHLVLSQS